MTFKELQQNVIAIGKKYRPERGNSTHEQRIGFRDEMLAVADKASNFPQFAKQIRFLANEVATNGFAALRRFA